MQDEIKTTIKMSLGGGCVHHETCVKLDLPSVPRQHPAFTLSKFYNHLYLHVKVFEQLQDIFWKQNEKGRTLKFALIKITSL